MIGVTFRPLAATQAPHTVCKPSPFTGSWSSTLQLLDRELRQLGAANVVVQIDVKEAMIRRDGWPQERAIVNRPGVALSFDSYHGPLRYETAAFSHWQDNLRAVALGLEALRKVDRYGIAKRGEQYRGYRELESGESTARRRGHELITEHGSVRAAERATHPDVGGDAEDFKAVQLAKAEGA